MEREKNMKKWVFVSMREDGTLTDELVGELLENEDEILEQLIKRGIVKRIVATKIKKDDEK